ncbi:hypothetical protein V1478_011392 [Vespula squamosa]|uniref:Secreted protein n=1 Tax=Vespula squamosa TaxID=30214 RepID=A0ABD2AED4_VESSQ
MTLWLRHVHVVCSVVASMPLKFRLICDHGATPKRSSQDHRQPAAPQPRSHQGLPLSNPSRVLRAVRGSLHSTQFPATALEKWQPPKYILTKSLG